VACWREVFDADPPPALEHRLHALNNSARLLENVRRYPEAEALMRRSLELKDAQLDVIQHYVHIRQKQCAWPHDLPVGEVTPTSSCWARRCWPPWACSDDPALQLLAAQRFVHEQGAQAAGRALAHADAAAQRPHPHRLPVGRPAHARRGPADARAVRAARPQPLRGLGLLLDARIAAAAAPAHPARRWTTTCAWPVWTTHRGQADRPGRHRRAGGPAGA
jgi:hypothetical protein